MVLLMRYLNKTIFLTTSILFSSQCFSDPPYHRSCDGELNLVRNGNTYNAISIKATRQHPTSPNSARQRARNTLSNCLDAQFNARSDLEGADKIHHLPGQCEEGSIKGYSVHEIDVRDKIKQIACTYYSSTIANSGGGILFEIKRRTKGLNSHCSSNVKLGDYNVTPAMCNF